MAEVTPDFRHVPKDRAYGQLHAHIIGVLSGIDDEVAGMATISALVHHGFGHLWTGFYRVVAPDRLVVGPYQGTLGCLEIVVGRGVCGTAAADRTTVIVPDVSQFPGHMACDARAKSEIVIPVFGRTGELIAVFDVDSARLSTFDREDARGLEAIVGWFSGVGRG